jgi:4-hydroxybutyrate CoA-transferase
VVTTRGHVHWIVTEYGAVNLFGRTLRQRAEAAHLDRAPGLPGELRRAFAETRHFILPELTTA